MSNIAYKSILQKAYSIKTYTEKQYKMGESIKWGYYICKAIVKPKTDIKSLKFDTAPNPSNGESISRGLSRTVYMDAVKRVINYVEKNKHMPNYVTIANRKVSIKVFCYFVSRVLVYYNVKGALPSTMSINSKCFTKPISNDEVFNYFVKQFGLVSTIDGALGKIAGMGYGYYYDDKYTNKQTIDRMKKGYGVNCTDSTHVFYHIGKALGYDVRCLHVQCSGGDGHVRLQLRHPKHTGGEWINRDPAAVLSSGNVTYNWCTSGYTLLAINPSWWVAQLNK